MPCNKDVLSDAVDKLTLILPLAFEDVEGDE